MKNPKVSEANQLKRIRRDKEIYALSHGFWVRINNWSYCISRDAGGFALIMEINRLKQSDPVFKAKKSGRDVIDVRSKKPWHPEFPLPAAAHRSAA